MQIDVVDHVAGAARARGIALVIDVFRAFTVAPHAVAAGASRVLPVGAIERHRPLCAAMPNAVLVGERHARRLPGFDAGNSPTEILSIGVGLTRSPHHACGHARTGECNECRRSADRQSRQRVGAGALREIAQPALRHDRAHGARGARTLCRDIRQPSSSEWVEPVDLVQHEHDRKIVPADLAENRVDGRYLLAQPVLR